MGLIHFDGDGKAHTLLDLFLTFAKIGLFTFGGGYAMLPLITDACVEKKKWITHEEMMDATVVAEATPGPISINCATFVGFAQAGFAGACAATFGIVIPSFTVIYLISVFFDQFLEFPVAAHAFRGIKIAVGFLILDAAWNMKKKMPKNKLSKGIFLASCCAMLLIDIFAWDFSSISLMLIASAASLSAYAVKELK